MSICGRACCAQGRCHCHFRLGGGGGRGGNIDYLRSCRGAEPIDRQRPSCKPGATRRRCKWECPCSDRSCRARLELLREIVPGLQPLGILIHVRIREPSSTDQRRAAAEVLGLEVLTGDLAARRTRSSSPRVGALRRFRHGRPAKQGSVEGQHISASSTGCGCAACGLTGSKALPRRRCTTSVRVPANTSMRTLTARTASAGPPSAQSRSANATPRKAAAGIVVIEIATPTAELALVSKERMPAIPATKATNTVATLTVGRSPRGRHRPTARSPARSRRRAEER